MMTLEEELAALPIIFTRAKQLADALEKEMLRVMVSWTQDDYPIDKTDPTHSNIGIRASAIGLTHLFALATSVYMAPNAYADAVEILKRTAGSVPEVAPHIKNRLGGPSILETRQ